MNESKNERLAGASEQCGLSGPGALAIDWKEIRREFAIVQRHVPVLGGEERPLVYLDHAATTHAPRSVIAAYVEFLEHEYSNIHRGTHLLSRRATERFEEAHGHVANFIGAELEQGAICFVTNTTQAIDLASHVMAHLPGKVVTTEMEHHSNELPHRRRGDVLRARIGSNGIVDLGHLEELLRRERIKLVAMTGAANVTGLLTDLRAVTRLAHEHGALVLVDAGSWVFELEWPEGEEIDVEPSNTGKRNYGWSVMEGNHCFLSASCDMTGKTAPVLEYAHLDGCSVTGGYVYRGSNIPGLAGYYLYGDYCLGWIRGFRFANGAATEPVDLTSDLVTGAPPQISSFGEDASGEIYVVDRSGGVVSRIDPE